MGKNNKKDNTSEFIGDCSAAADKNQKAVLDHILGQSQAVATLHRNIRKIAGCDVSVLITGESGTGKEPAARAIHCLSHRKENPFITVNCAAIPENLFENELFGHVKGAFTDAQGPQKGVVPEAETGTLFLDEIGVIKPYSQVKLLRLLQHKEYKPLGDSQVHHADIRVIAATNEDLSQLVEKGDFRADLYYRLNIVTLHIPPLRERKEDIPTLARHFVKKYSLEYSKEVWDISKDAMLRLLQYHWPGNIRELENKIQQAIVLSSGPVISDNVFQFPRENVRPAANHSNHFKEAKDEVIKSFEKDYITRLLTQFNGDIVSAAASAGKSRTALWNLITKHHLHPRQFTKNGS